MPRSRIGVVLALGTTQTLAWASSYYLPAILALSIAEDLRVAPAWVFAAFSWALVVSGLLGPRVGRIIDRYGGRKVLALSNLIFAAGLAQLALAQSLPVLWLAWTFIGIGMGFGLYDAAFATLGRLYGDDARSAITGITLMAGFASTLGWPLTAWGNDVLGWQYTCLAWALAHLILGAPLNRWVLPRAPGVQSSGDPDEKPEMPMDRTMWLLAFAFAAGWVVSTAMAVHLPALLQAAGATNMQAIFAGTLIGPAQVGARLVEAGFLTRYHPLLSARLSTLMHPLGAVLLAIWGGPMAAVFASLHGAGNGILTIARGTVPLAVFGPKDYGYRLGLLGAPARISQAAAPLAFGLLIERYGAGALVVSSGLCLSAAAALLLVASKADVGCRGHRLDQT